MAIFQFPTDPAWELKLTKHSCSVIVSYEQAIIDEGVLCRSNLRMAYPFSETACMWLLYPMYWTHSAIAARSCSSACARSCQTGTTVALLAAREPSGGWILITWSKKTPMGWK